MSDCKKLTRVVKNLRTTVYLPFVIGLVESGTLLWSIYASFAVHSYMRSYTGVMLMFRQGTVFSMSNKQKVNSRRSTLRL